MRLVADYLKQYSETYHSLHMPGHKGGLMNPLKEMDLFALDITETVGSDDLYHPETFLKASLMRTKAFYKTQKSYYLVNGSTGGLLTAISGCTNKGDQVLIQRNAHHGVYNAIVARDLEPIYIYPKLHTQYGFYGGICPQELENLLITYKNISLVVVTSPSYEGLVLDIEQIASVVHKYGKILLVDEAHGAHFPFYDFAPKSALEKGADVVVQSLHKTLPALTQTALLHVKTKFIDLNKMDFYYEMYQTSSPSFLLVASIDSCLEAMKCLKKSQLALYEARLKSLYLSVNDSKDFHLITMKDLQHLNIINKDITRLTLVGKQKPLSGTRISQQLMADSKIVLELIGMHYVVGISTIADSETFLAIVKESILGLVADKDCKSYGKFVIIEGVEQVMTPSEAISKEKASVAIEESIGSVSGGYIKVYPPSVPLVVPGELITKEIVEVIAHYNKSGLMVHGIIDERIQVIQ